MAIELLTSDVQSIAAIFIVFMTAGVILFNLMRPKRSACGSCPAVKIIEFKSAQKNEKR